MARRPTHGLKEEKFHAFNGDVSIPIGFNQLSKKEGREHLEWKGVWSPHSKQRSDWWMREGVSFRKWRSVGFNAKHEGVGKSTYRWERGGPTLQSNEKLQVLRGR